MRPLYVAVVGSGPSGFYAAAALLRQREPAIHVDMLERLPTPWGLVRFGVAPDHPKIKSVSAVFDKTAAHERFRFFGNIELGREVEAAELAARYDAVIYALGAPSDKRLDVPGEHLAGSVAAGDVVGWYNGHPDHTGVPVGEYLTARRAVVIGNGNVALDIARMLAMPAQELRATDIADHAIPVLERSSITEVVVVGRRGPLQAAFTPAELRELGALDGVDVRVDPADLEAVSDADVEAAGSTVALNIAALREFAQREATPSARRTITLRFCRSPVELRGDHRVRSIVLERNALRTGEDGRVVAEPTGEREELAAGLVIRAVGYRGIPCPGLPFDECRGVIPNVDGRIEGRRHEYVSGWIKRGPSGIIGTNKKCAGDTVKTLLADLASAELPARDPDHHRHLAEWIRSRRPSLVTYGQWQVVDAHERALGEPAGRPRVKLCSIPELLRVAHGRA
ncbi:MULTISPECIES: FAD-dependent oxidoreductase [Pseudonocardiaceae]|uniref:FAD-dependent oxidoreductase n=1 Tax=Pseudonocardiaceae TaxID=2070 RepID=UPI00248F19AB|nr:FAD-dependent oxidoreductase [Pseudonocardia thermophila]